MEDGAKKPNCRWQDPANWKTFDEVANEPLIGFVFAAEDGFVGIDLDDCLERSWNPSDFAMEVLDRFEATAYAEVSPSGTGIKLWTRGRKPDGCRSVNRAAGLEVYGEGRWFAVTGRVILGMEDIGDGQAGIDWLVQHYLSAPEPKRVDIPLVRFKESDLMRRARDYASHADAPGPGDRNNTAFRLAGNLFVMVQPDGERLSVGDVASVMQEWNARLPAPLEAKELQTVVESAGKNGTPRSDKEAARPVEDTGGVDLSRLLAIWSTKEQADADEDDQGDEEFCAAMVPPKGILREVFDHYWESAYAKSSVMGMAVALSLCETIFGRRIQSQSGMRTNDYNLILAPTGSGKDACEKSIKRILMAADPSASHLYPGKMASGGGLEKAMSIEPCGIWVADEFGKVLQAILDKKGNYHLKEVGSNLLKMYSSSDGYWGGSAHSDGVRNQIVQPHLVVLAMSTGSTVFSAISSEQVSDGLFGRIAFWPVQERPDGDERLEIVKPSDNLIHRVAQWIKFAPGGNLGSHFPDPPVLRNSEESQVRYEYHSKEIRKRMKGESESRAAIWARVAARSMKLALVHRAARLETDPSLTSFDFVKLEIEDWNWAIKLSNWLARIACDLVKENTVDSSLEKAKAALKIAVKQNGSVNSRDFLRTYRSLTEGDVVSAAAELGMIAVKKRDKNRGRSKLFYEYPANLQAE